MDRVRPNGRFTHGLAGRRGTAALWGLSRPFRPGPFFSSLSPSNSPWRRDLKCNPDTPRWIDPCSAIHHVSDRDQSQDSPATVVPQMSRAQSQGMPPILPCDPPAVIPLPSPPSLPTRRDGGKTNSQSVQAKRSSSLSSATETSPARPVSIAALNLNAPTSPPPKIARISAKPRSSTACAAKSPSYARD